MQAGPACCPAVQAGVPRAQALETDDQENEGLLRKIQERMHRRAPPRALRTRPQPGRPHPRLGRLHSHSDQRTTCGAPAGRERGGVRRGRVGIEPPQVEVRFERLCVEADVVVGARGLPSVGNSVRASGEVRAGRACRHDEMRSFCRSLRGFEPASSSQLLSCHSVRSHPGSVCVHAEGETPCSDLSLRKGCACAEAAGLVRHPRGAEARLSHPQGRHRHPAAGEALRLTHNVQWTLPTTTWLIHCLHSLQHIQVPSLAACRSACQAKSASDVSTSRQWRPAMHAGAQPTSQIKHTETSGARHALQGRMMLLLGPPGGGKTTLLNALAGKLHSSKGLRVRFILCSTAAVWFPAIHDTLCHAAHLLPAVSQFSQSMLLFQPPKP